MLAANSQPAIDAKRRVIVLAAVGAVGLILTLLVSLLLGRSINRRLTTLRRSALTLAQEQLPSVVARLRRGESVDVAAEAPPLRVGSDEIGQVGQAIDAVRQTAIRSAIEEARVRQGVNDMFRNLARRNQSLLQRQLTVLDEMERRATDPDVLEDLFKMDHLTTRMRRHAEGLIILSGAPPGRSWSAPVKLIDVMRGAVAEVEDYARVTVSTQSRAALAGSAVTDVIHLLAELIENATTLSPPFTQVRVGGETVANGFAIEIEDRGLGMVPQRLQELNERLANPPDINPANTEQLGLFVVGQLARRHGIRVMLRPSPYGGTTAVVLIPLALIVEDGPAAITSGRAPAAAGRRRRAVRRQRAEPAAAAHTTRRRTTGAYATAPRAPGPAAPTGQRAGAGPRPPATAPRRRPALATRLRHACCARPGDRPRTGPKATRQTQDPGGLPIRISGALRPPASTGGFGRPAATEGGAPAPGAVSPQSVPPNTVPPAPGRRTGPPALCAATPGPQHPAASTGEPGARRGRHDTDDVPVVTGVPVGRPTAPCRRRPSTSSPRSGGWSRTSRRADPASTPRRRHRGLPGFRRPGPALTPTSPYGSAPEPPPARQATAPTRAATRGRKRNLRRQRNYGNEAAYGNHGDSPDSYDARTPRRRHHDYKGLPRRVRQANLAPQLRASAKAGAQGTAVFPRLPRHR